MARSSKSKPKGKIMSRSRSSVLLAGILVHGATQALGAPLCKPVLSINAVRMSDVRLTHKVWTAQVAVDASRCAVSAGRFDIRFVRLKENSPDLRFNERFTWKPGQVEISSEFSADETVAEYAIGDVAPCACRE